MNITIKNPPKGYLAEARIKGPEQGDHMMILGEDGEFDHIYVFDQPPSHWESVGIVLTPRPRWRAEKGGEFYYVFRFTECGVNREVDIRCPPDDELYAAGNYFRTKEQAQKAAKVIKEALLKLHAESEE